MFEYYKNVIIRYKKLPLKDERKLISFAKNGNVLAQEKILLHLTRYLIFRIRTLLFPSILYRHGDDILHNCFILTIQKIHTYNLKYKNKGGQLQPLHLSTYIWKSITGYVYGFLKERKEICFSDFSYSTIRDNNNDFINLNEM